MNPFRKLALLVLSIALAAELAWLCSQLNSGTALTVLQRPLSFTFVFLLVALTGGRIQIINTLGRWTVASAFLLALWSRFDNFPGFVRYAGTVLSFAPPAAVPALAVMATSGEVVCCGLLILGFRTRWACAAAGGLLLTFALSMTISGLSQFDWAVYVLAFGSLLLSLLDTTLFSLDSLTTKKDMPWKSTAETH